MAAAAGALRSCFGDPAGRSLRHTRSRGQVFTYIPVSLRTADTMDELGNITSTVRVPLPLHTDTPAARLMACRGLVDAFGPRALAVPELLARLVSLLGPRAMDAVLARAGGPPFVAVGCTALPWGRAQLTLGGHPLSRVVAFPVVQPAGGCAFVLSGYADTSAIAVTTHRLPGDARDLADAFAHEIDLLAALGAA
ncbi:WS/DGAT domain-containing protein [Streptomyces olivoreticuli]|uniref:WS/DGAT domain-containing protein n=1 Tax=Streptomyces olivoreticuli TaxID=68246 RepID=UPI001F084C03|nr:WS/DGAT domain-containing protein [Streptomyces olivoreticuli]